MSRHSSMAYAHVYGPLWRAYLSIEVSFGSDFRTFKDSARFFSYNQDRQPI